MDANEIRDEVSSAEEILTKVKIVRCPQCDNPIDVHFWDEKSSIECGECGCEFDKDSMPEMVIRRFI